MSLMSKVFPPENIALEMEPEELAVPLLECLCQFEETNAKGMLNRYTFTLQSNLQEYGQNNYNEIAKVISEAWVWLEKEGLIAPAPTQTGDWVFITRRGRKFRQTADVRNYRAASLLPDKTLDPRLASKVRPPFLRGDYDTAVFEAYKEVEVRVRALAPEHKTELGVNLMRKAFHPENGPLTDNAQVFGERQAISDLFAGAIGSFKNPSSHRDVDFGDPAEVVELIMLADQLIRIAERRTPGQ
jgi:uncharacterized protein (TIGR02391 family)